MDLQTHNRSARMFGSHLSLRPRLWEWAQVVLLCANFAWTTLCLGGYRAETMVVTSLLTAGLLLVHGMSIVAGRPARSEVSPADRADQANSSSGTPAPWFHPAGWLFLPFLAYAAANVMLVSPVRWLGWFDWFGWAQLIAVFWVVLNGRRSPAAECVIWTTLFGMAAAAVLLGSYQYFVKPDWLMLGRLQADQYAGRASGCFGIPNSLGGLLILLIPVAAALALRRAAGATARVFFGWLTLVLGFGLVLTISRGAWLALACAMMLWPLLSGRLAWRRRLAFASGMAALLLLLGGVAYTVSPRVQARFAQLARDTGERSRPILWRAAGQMIAAHPVLGTGGGSFDVVFERYRPEGFLRSPQWTHNDYLNTLSDYGAVGFILFFGAAMLTLARAWRAQVPRVSSGSEFRCRSALDDPVVRQAQAVGLLAFALQLLVDFHLKIPALALAFATIAAFVVRQRWVAGSLPRPSVPRAAAGALRRVSVLVCATVSTALIVFAIVPRFRAEALRDRARERINLLIDIPVDSSRFEERIHSARTDLSRAVELAPDNAQAWADQAYAAAQWARLKPAENLALASQAEADANRAITLAPSVAEFWIRRGVARDMQGRWLEAGDDFTRALTLSPMTPLPWFHQAYHLALDATTRDLAAAMVAACLRLDPNNSEGIRLRQQLANGHPRP